MRGKRAQKFVLQYLEAARGNLALEASVLASGERLGFREPLLRRAAARLDVVVDAKTRSWSLPNRIPFSPEPLSPRAAPLTPTLSTRTHGLV